jgi:hypothetical protein
MEDNLGMMGYPPGGFIDLIAEMMKKTFLPLNSLDTGGLSFRNLRKKKKVSNPS